MQTLFAMLSLLVVSESEIDLNRYVRQSQSERMQAISEARADRSNGSRELLHALQNPIVPYYGKRTLGFFLKRGDVGRLQERISLEQKIDGYKLAHEIDATNFIAVASWEQYSARDGQVTGDNFIARGGEVIGFGSSGSMEWARLQSSAASSTKRRPERYLLFRGVKADDGVLVLDGFFAMTGTEEFGGDTVNVIEPVDDIIEKNKDRFTCKDEARTWTSKSGTFSTEAIFVGLERGKVSLIKLDGHSVDVPMEKLSDADREYVREELKSRRKTR